MVVYYAASSLDGYIAGPDDEMSWLTEYEGSDPWQPEGSDPSEEPGGYEEFYADVGALVSGSVTYEWILEHASTWHYAGKPYWVMTSRELPGVDGEDVRFNGSFDEMIASAGDRKLWVVGGGGIASQFAEAGRLDQVWVTIVPVVLGGGKPLFERPLPGGPMRLTETLPRANGMVELRYSR